MDNQKTENKNIFIIFLTEFIRIKGTLNWTSISFIGFVLGMTSLILSEYIFPIIVFFISTFCIMSFTFSINNFYDANSDRNNPRRKNINAIASGKISTKTSKYLILILIITPLIITFLYNNYVFLFCIFLIFWMWIYSSPPFRLKGRPGLDIIWHFFTFIFIILWGSFISGSINQISLMVAISFGIWSCIAQLWNHLSDYSFDKKSKTKTFAVSFGLDITKKTLRIITIFHILFLLVIIYLFSLNYIYTIAILILGLIFVIFLIKSKLDFPLSTIYYKSFIFAYVVYLCCIVYHILFLLEKPTIGLIFWEIF